MLGKKKVTGDSQKDQQRIAEMLRGVALDMGAIANMMGRYAGEAEWAKHSSELRSAASMAMQWAYEIESMTSLGGTS